MVILPTFQPMCTSLNVPISRIREFWCVKLLQKKFFKAPRSTRESYKILGAHADQTRRRRGFPSILGTRHSEAHAHLHTHAHTPTHRPQHPIRHQSCDHGNRTLAGRLATASTTTEPLACVLAAKFDVLNLAEHDTLRFGRSGYLRPSL
jgi:hypothetical protein